MPDARKSAEAVKKIQDLQRTILNHQSNVARFERDKGERVRYFDQQIKREQDEIKRHNQQIAELKRQI